MRYFLEKTKQLITLRLSILAIFISFFVLSILLVISISYYRSANNTSYLATQLMQHISSTIYDQIVNMGIIPSELEVKLTAQLIDRSIIDVKNRKQFVAYMLNVIKLLPLVQGAFWSNEQGDFWDCEEEADYSYVRIIDRSDSPATHTITYFNLHDDLIKSVSSPDLSFDPRTRPWYVGAKATKKLFWADIYQYRFSKLYGTAVAMPVYKNGLLLGIFTLNLRLDHISKFVNQNKVSPHGISFIVTTKGELVAMAGSKDMAAHFKPLMNIHTATAPWLVESFKQYQKNGQSQFSFEYKGRNYFASYKKIPQLDKGSQGWLIGVVAPEEDFIGVLRKTNLITIGISLIILALGITLVSKFVTRIVRPLNHLVQQTEKIKNFDLEGEDQVKSRIREILSIANAVESMKKGLRSFKKYVPANLVRQLIDTGQDAHIGGEKKELAIFFSDIKNFTSISEHLDPDKLVTHMCAYLEELSHIITQQRGTIDKYIGDSIMAFWGAPLLEAEPAQQAALAALQCQEALNKMNTIWAEEKKPVLITRIGLHLGEAIVGNIGSRERLNYTAIGDTINMASRLESLNKIYGTKIIASQTLYNALSDKFIWRMLDYVSVKGKEQSSYIYELIATKGSTLSYDLDAYHEFFKEGFSAYQQQKWDEAIDYFKKSAAIYTEDAVAALFIQRCITFKLKPPSTDWNGIWHFTDA